MSNDMSKEQARSIIIANRDRMLSQFTKEEIADFIIAIQTYHYPDSFLRIADKQDLMEDSLSEAVFVLRLCYMATQDSPVWRE